MRLLLEAHVSARRVGRPLGRKGHDVFALAEDASYDGLTDEDVLALASAEGRILVTHDVDDFSTILRDWAGAGRSHAGVILVHGIRHHEYKLVVEGVAALLAARSEQRAWTDICEALSRGRFES